MKIYFMLTTVKFFKKKYFNLKYFPSLQSWKYKKERKLKTIQESKTELMVKNFYLAKSVFVLKNAV